MFNWAKQKLADVAGTAEPIHGAAAFHSVAEQAKDTPYTELKRGDTKWQVMESTCVETQTFYFTAANGRIGYCQVIYNNIAGIKTTCQFSAKVFSTDPAKPQTWSSVALDNVEFSEDKSSFFADSCAVELNEDGTVWTIKSMVDEKCIVNMTVTRLAPGYQAGKNGISTYGTDPAEPWGSMRHAYWPRCKAEGTFTTDEGAIDFSGHAFYVYALQGMKPHHAAARWNFVTFQGPTYSANVMEFTTPISYDNSKVSIGSIVKDGEILAAGPITIASHTKTYLDQDTEWNAPEEMTFNWSSKTKDGKAINASIGGKFDLMDRVDVMAEVPTFVKKFIGAAAGTKPYIYQFSNHKSKQPLKLRIGEEEITEQGALFVEASFVSK